MSNVVENPESNLTLNASVAETLARVYLKTCLPVSPDIEPKRVGPCIRPYTVPLRPEIRTVHRGGEDVRSTTLSWLVDRSFPLLLKKYHLHMCARHR